MTADNKADEYEYVSKNDRLTLKNKGSYALKDAKVIFAVKPHNGMDDYIQYDRPGIDALFVDEDDVLAVKAADIPDIGDGKDTLTNTLDHNASTTSRKSWINDTTAKVAIDADGNKDINAAVLGVNNFNKFNAGSTKVGLVTNVSYDKNDVVSIDVATNGKVETLSSVEKTSFDDVVSVMDYTNKTSTKSVSVGSRTETIKAGIFDDQDKNGTSLKDYLNKNGAYAEITTNADGKLTGVLFMDTKKDHDGATSGVNEGNVVVGDYYQVSRKVVADVKEGSWMSVIKGSAEYADADNFKTMDTKNEQKAADFTSDATYYLIDGKPTKHGNVAYAGSKASVVDGFDGNPDIKAAEASDVRKSDIRNDGDSANDIYNVADVASKIDDKGEGDIVAVYMYDDDMGEKIGLKAGAAVAITGGSVVVGNQTEITVTLPTDDKNLGDAYVEVVKTDADGKETVVVEKVTVKNGEKYNLDTSKLTVGDYKIKLYGYNVSDKTYEVLKEEKLTIKDKAAATTVEFTDAAGTPTTPKATDTTLFFRVLDADQNVVTDVDLAQVKVYRNNVEEVDAVVAGSINSSKGVYTIQLKRAIGTDDIQVRYGTAAGGEQLQATIELPNGGKVTVANGTQLATPANDVTVTLANADKAALKVWKGDTKYADATTTVKEGDITATVNGDKIQLTSTGALNNAGDTTFTVGISDTVKATLTITVEAPKPSVTLATPTLKETAFGTASKESNISVGGSVVASELKIGSGGAIGGTKTATDAATGVTATVSGAGDKVTLSGKIKAAGTAEFTIGTADATAKLTVTVDKATLTTATVACTATNNKVVLTVDSADIATALAADLNAKAEWKTDLIYSGAATADTALDKSKIKTVTNSGSTVEIELETSHGINAAQKIKVKLAGLANFNDKESDEGTVA